MKSSCYNLLGLCKLMQIHILQVELVIDPVIPESALPCHCRTGLGESTGSGCRFGRGRLSPSLLLLQCYAKTFSV